MEMNETLIKELIKIKINAAGAIVDNLPPKIAEEMKGFRKIVLESIKESLQDMEEQPAKDTKSGNKLESINIE